MGDVQRPGAYDISSLSSPLTALSAAGGPTAVGSLRLMRHYRNEKLIGEIDLYDFLLHGMRSTEDRLQGGDTLLVPPAGPQVAVYGAVKRPAIYELRNEKTMTAVLDEAGGLTVAAALGHITVDRIVANQRREEISLTNADSEDVHGGNRCGGGIRSEGWRPRACGRRSSLQRTLRLPAGPRRPPGQAGLPRRPALV